jgi:predicted lipid-binding transport protein (Tim44 family)
MTANTGADVPQFSTAEYSATPPGVTCAACAKPVSGTFYRVNGAPACPDCAQRLRREAPQDSHKSFVRGVLFGIGAAVLGFALYVAFALSTGLVIGFVSLAVGYLVGKAIMLGSRGVGGRRYQVAAALLTYMAVSLAAVPIAFHVHSKHASTQQTAQENAPDSVAAPNAAPPARPKMTAARALGTLTLIGLASPFLDLASPMHGIIGLIILLVGVRIAWQLTAASSLRVDGPFDGAPAPA